MSYYGGCRPSVLIYDDFVSICIIRTSVCQIAVWTRLLISLNTGITILAAAVNYVSRWQALKKRAIETPCAE
jgi:hypothetical protein